jgi:hypothetical protein
VFSGYLNFSTGLLLLTICHHVGAAVTSFFSTGLVTPTLCKHVLQRFLHFSARISNFVHYVNMSCNGYVILQHATLITYTMSTCDEAVFPFFSNDHVLPTLGQQVLQRLRHFTARVSYYLHSLYMSCRGYFILQQGSHITYTISSCAAAISSFYSTGLVLPTLILHVLQRLFHFTRLISYYIIYVIMFCSVYFILQHGSLITYTMSTCAAAVT